MRPVQTEGHIYTVTGFTEKDVIQAEKRCFGFFHSLEDARMDTICNGCDINEGGTFPYIVIEEVEEGFYPISMKREFYRFDEASGKYALEKEEPKDLKYVCGFGIG